MNIDLPKPMWRNLVMQTFDDRREYTKAEVRPFGGWGGPDPYPGVPDDAVVMTVLFNERIKIAGDVCVQSLKLGDVFDFDGKAFLVTECEKLMGMMAYRVAAMSYGSIKQENELVR